MKNDEIIDEFRKEFGRFWVGHGEVDREKGVRDILASDEIEEWLIEAFEAKDKEWKDKTLKATKQIATPNCTSFDRCAAEHGCEFDGWNRAMDSVRDKLINQTV